MASKITQRIALEGAEEIKRLLTDLGRAGEKAFDDLRKGAGNVDFQKVERGARELADTSARLAGDLQKVGGAASDAGRGLTQAGSSANQANSAFKSTASSLSNLLKVAAGVAAGVGLVGAAILKVAKDAASAASEIGKAALKAGTDIKDYQEAKFALEQLGITGEEAAGALKKVGETGATAFEAGKKALKELNIVFPDTEEGAAKAAKRIEDLSKVTINGKRAIDAETAALVKFRDGLSVETLAKFADQLKEMNEEAAKSLAVKVFGEDIGRVLLPKLREGGEAIRGFGKDFEGLRLGVNATQAEIGLKFVIAMNRFNAAAKQGRTELGLLFAPIATEAIRTWTDLIRQNREMLTGWAEAIKASVRPVLEDLFRLFKEGMGAEVKTEWLSKVRDGLVAIGAIITNVIKPAFATLSDAAKAVAAAINQAFGTELTAADVGIAGVITFLIGGLNTLGIAILALFADKAPAAVQKFKEALKSFGVDIDAIKKTVSEFFQQLVADLKALSEGRNQDIKFTWLVDLKAALTSLPAVLAEVVAILTVLLRLAATRPGIALTGFILNLTGLLPILTFAINALVAAVTILGGILTIIGIAFGATAAAIAGLVVVAAVAGVAIYLFWNEIVAAATKAWEKIKSDAQIFWNDLAKGWTIVDEAVKAAFDSIEKYIAEKFAAIMESARKAWEYIKGLFSSPIGKGVETPAPSVGGVGVPLLSGQEGGSFADRLIRSAPQSKNIEDRRGENQAAVMTEQFRAAVEQIKELIEEANTALVEMATKAAEAITTAFGLIGPAIDAAIAAIAERVTAGATAIGEALLTPFQTAATGIEGVMSGLGSLIDATFAALNQAIASAAAQVQSAINDIIASLEAAVAKAQELAAAAASAGSSGGGSSESGGGEEFAWGGYTGPGGKYAPAGIVHRGEYVQPQRVVRRPGVLPFMEGLRRTGDLRSMIERFRGFNAGGLVPDLMHSLAIPSFAGGGLANQSISGARVTVDLRTNDGVFQVLATPDTVGNLYRAAAKRQLASGGQRPRG